MAEGQLTVNISEALTLQGSDFGSSASITYSNITRYDKFVKEIATTSYTTLYTCSDDGASADYDSDKVSYARITNYDTTNSVFIELEIDDGTDESADGYVAFEIVAGGTFLIQNHNGFIDDDNSAGRIMKVKAEAETAAVKIEVFIALLADD